MIEGREFVPVLNGTFSHDIWLTKKIREAGLSGLALLDGETQDEFIDRIAMMAYESGLALELLGGLFMPADIDARQWTPEMAIQTSGFFGNVTNEQDKKTLRMQIASAIFYFFVNALASSATSLKSGAKTEADGRHETEDASSTGIGHT